VYKVLFKITDKRKAHDKERELIQTNKCVNLIGNQRRDFSEGRTRELKRQKEIIKCSCGRDVTKNQMSKHIKSMIHKING
jgi:hypothetical protein